MDRLWASLCVTVRGIRGIFPDMKQRSFELPEDPVIEVYKKDIDRTLIRENLQRTVEERFLQLMKLQRLAEELRRANTEKQSEDG